MEATASISDRKYRLFLSHIHEEKNLAVSFKQEIEKLYLGAVEVFVSSDEGGIRGGDRWLQVIEEKLRHSSLILILASPESIKRPWINFEAGGAWFMSKKVIPLCVLGMTPDSLPEPLRSLQARNLQNLDDLRMVLSDISSNAGLGVPTTSVDLSCNAIFSAVEEIVAQSSSMPAPGRAGDEKGDELKPLLYEKSSVFFANRCADAFPGIRGLHWFAEPKEAVERLTILLREPLAFNLKSNESSDPIWWWRGDSNGHITNFNVLIETKCLMDIYEFEVNRLAVYRDETHTRDFVYIEMNPEPPTGLNDIPYGYIDHQIGSYGYSWEEYALLDGRSISRYEYDDGAAVLDGNIVYTRGAAKLRVRFLSKYNLLVSPKFSPINSQDFDDISHRYLNGILAGTHKFEDFLKIISRLPRFRE